MPMNKSTNQKGINSKRVNKDQLKNINIEGSAISIKGETLKESSSDLMLRTLELITTYLLKLSLEWF